MLARSFLSKLLNFPKSSRLVLILTVVFANFVNANPTNVSSSRSVPQLVRKNNQTPPPSQETFKRTPTWPA